MSCRRKMRRPGKCIFVCVFSFTAFVALAMLTSRDRRNGRTESKSVGRVDNLGRRHLRQPIKRVDQSNVNSNERGIFKTGQELETAARSRTDNASRSRTLKDVDRSNSKSAEIGIGSHSTTQSYQTKKVVKSIKEHFEEVKQSLQKLRNSTKSRQLAEKPKSIKLEHLSSGIDNASEPCVRIGVFAGKNSGRWNGTYQCPETSCVIDVVQSFKPSLLREAHAVFIPHSSLQLLDFDHFSRSRSPNQLWIFVSFESPIHTTRLSNRLARFGFNWTFTYRTDATFPSPYGRYKSGEALLPENGTTNWARGKTKFAAWIGSNCHNTGWPRFEFVSRLQEFIQLDTFGSCGTKSCPKNPKCGETLRKYKFYFALENSNCKDYITEKFWEAPFKNNLIPVVYGPSRGDYEKVAPPKSFIHIDDFSTMSELADYLTLLNNNDTLYNEYFKWKEEGTVEGGLIGDYYHSKKVMCRIAPKIRELRAKGPLEAEVLDMKAWWTDTCHGKRPAMMNNNHR